MRTSNLVSLALFAGGLACSKPAPEKPTWFDDVEPVIRGSCAQCHGATAKTTSGTFELRFDICDAAKIMEDVGVDPGEGLESATLTGANKVPMNYFTTALGSGVGRMPPAPALPLADYEHDVIRAWGALKAADRVCGKRPHNQKPKVKKVSAKGGDGGLVVTVDATDADGDTVIGKLTAGAAEGVILHSGRSVLTLAGASDGDTVHFKVSDGSDVFEGDL